MGFVGPSGAVIEIFGEDGHDMPSGPGGSGPSGTDSDRPTPDPAYEVVLDNVALANLTRDFS
jgi:hypothetical protein